MFRIYISHLWGFGVLGPTEGQAFDPERMNAVATVPATTSCPAATVARESSPGYLLAGEVLRLAEVEIAD